MHGMWAPLIELWNNMNVSLTLEHYLTTQIIHLNPKTFLQGLLTHKLFVVTCIKIFHDELAKS